LEKFAVIVAAGLGTRMGKSLPKQFLLLNEKPLLLYTLQTFLNAFSDLRVILVVSSSYISQAEAIVKSTGNESRISITPGGDTRFHSVQNGLKLAGDDAIVFVHDAVRCLVTEDLIRRCYAAALELGNAIPTIKPADSLRVETHSGNSVIDRSRVHIVQTPQTFRAAILKAAFSRDYEESFTDEATVVELMGERINLIEGEPGNIKITTPTDLLIAASILAERK